MGLAARHPSHATAPGLSFFSTGLSSRARDGSKIGVILAGTSRLPVMCRPALSNNITACPPSATCREISSRWSCIASVSAWGQRERRPDAAGRADRAEQIGVFVALICGLARPGSASCPLPNLAVLLADAGLVLKPDFNRRRFPAVPRDKHVHARAGSFMEWPAPPSGAVGSPAVHKEERRMRFLFLASTWARMVAAWLGSTRPAGSFCAARQARLARNDVSKPSFGVDIVHARRFDEGVHDASAPGTVV